jgi:hypothetical protein
LDERQQEAIRNAEHASLNWVACYDDFCRVHIGEKDGAGWYPQEPARYDSSVDRDEPYATQPSAPPSPPPPTAKRPKKVYKNGHEKTAWEHCFRNNCVGHRDEKIKAGYYPKKFGIRQSLSTKDAIIRKARETVRTRLEREGSENSEKTIPDPEQLQRQISELLAERDRLRETIAIQDETIGAQQATIDHQQRSLEIGGLTLEMARKEAVTAQKITRRVQKDARHFGRQLLELGK